ncbi:MAG TPA: AAA family ATPase [Rhizomicrobium sp.]|nr:AAA family ATPase [Rhizomicrobium sp.]
MGSVLILTGPPGAGKSTVADVLARSSRVASVHLHTDDFYDRFIKSGYVLPWLPESQKQNETVTHAVATAAFAYARGGYFVIVDGIVGPWFVEPYRAAAGDIPLHYAVLRPESADLAVKRVMQRRTHGLQAEDVVRELYRQLSDLGIFEKHALDTTGLSIDETAERLRTGMADGRLLLG